MVNSLLMLCAFTKIFFSKYWHVPVYFCCVSKACPISLYDIFIEVKEQGWENNKRWEEDKQDNKI